MKPTKMQTLRAIGLKCGLKTPLHILSEHNGKKIDLHRTNVKSQGLVPAHFALIIIIVVHVYSKTSISINKYAQRAGELENDTGFPKVIIIAAVHVAS